MSSLKRIRDFKAPKDEASQEDLRRQLVAFESNVSDMGNAITQAAQQRLSAGSLPVGTSSAAGLVVAPGQFQTIDTRPGVVRIGLAKPARKDAGTFVVLIDIGGGANNMNVRCDGCLFDSAVSVVFAVTFAALIFCDGTNYWRIRG